MNDEPAGAWQQREKHQRLLRWIKEATSGQAPQRAEEINRLEPQVRESLYLLQEILEDLQELRDQAQEIESHSTSDADPRDNLPGAAMTAGVVVDYLQRYGIPTRLLKRFAEAGVDINTGRVCLMLTPSKAAGRKGTSSYNIQLWAATSACVTLLIEEEDIPKAEAFHQMVKCLRKGNLWGPGDHDRSEKAQAKSLSGWYRKLQSGRHDDGRKDLYWHLLTDLRQQHQGQKREPSPEWTEDLMNGLTS